MSENAIKHVTATNSEQEAVSSVELSGAVPLPPDELDPWEVKERITVGVGQMAGKPLRWRAEEIGAPHMKGFLFDPSGND